MTKTTTPAAKPANAAAPAVDAPEKAGATTEARVLAAVTLAGVRHAPGVLLEGVPVALAKAHADSLDAHPDAVAHARADNAPVFKFEPEAASEAGPDPE